MDYSQRKVFAQRLLTVLKKILEIKNVDDNYVDKILSDIDNELRTHNLDIVNTCTIFEWLSETIENWKKTQVSLHEAEFICKFIGLLSKYNEAFQILQSKSVLNDLISVLKNDLQKHTTLKIIFIKMLSAMLDHNSGCVWIRTCRVWQLVVNICFSNVNLYIEREGIIFFKKLIFIAKNEDNFNEEILQHVFLPIQENLRTEAKDKNYNSYILLFLKLLEIILKLNIFSENSGFYLKVEKTSIIETFLKNLTENSVQGMTLEAAIVSQVLFSILKVEDKEKLLSAENIPAILDLFYILIKHKEFNCIIRVAKYCQTLWNEMRTQMHCENTFGVNYTLIQLLPSLMCVKMPITDTQHDLFMKKFFNQKCPELQTFFNTLGKAVTISFDSKPIDLAVKGILSVVTSLDNINLDEAVLIFETLLFITKSIIFENGYDLETTTKIGKKSRSYTNQNNSLLSSILNGIPPLLEKYKINRTDLEALGLFKITHCLLDISDLPSLIVVQVLQVVKVVILNCLLPDVSCGIHTNFEHLVPRLYKLITNTSWEIRDSCIEVVIAIAQLKYPGFEQMLLERDFCSLLLNIVENDTESYVRASAIRALIIMTKIEVLNPFVNDQDSCLKIIKLVETESEGIVRREAALLIKEIYLTLNDQHNDLIHLLYKVMGGAALCDLHWEVKINSLVFWEAVIQRVITDQTICEYSPSTASSNKEIIHLSNDDMKLELDKYLRKLSKIGCLHVLLTVLKDDCDMIVIKKSAEVLSGLLSVLKHYNVTETDISSFTAKYRKRKNSGLVEYEKNKRPGTALHDSSDGGLLLESVSMFSAKSEEIIDEIVNDTDINLLKNVSSQYEEMGGCLKSVFLKEVEPEAFFSQMQGFDKDQFLENKQKWFMNVETDLTLTMNSTNTESLVNEINVMDCY